MKLVVDTVISTIIKDGYIKPQSPIYKFVNKGEVNVYINKNFLLRPGAEFGVNADAFVATFLHQDIAVENNTQFEITFENISFLKQLILVETSIKKS